MQSKLKILILSLSTFYILELFFFKYYHNGLSLSDYSFFYFGNLLNILPFLLIVWGLIVKNRMGKFAIAELKFMLVISVLEILLLSLAFPLSQENYLSKIFLVTYSYSRILTLLFLLFSFALYSFKSFYLISSKPTFGKSWARVFFAILLLLGYAITLNIKTQKEAESSKHYREKFDVGVIMGAAVWRRTEPSPIFRGRIMKAVQLYREHLINKIQVTGGKSPGEIAEGRAAKIVLLKNGIPMKDILPEYKTKSTIEQIRFIKEQLITKGRKRVLVISDAFHLRRIFEMCDFFGIKVNGISSEYRLNWRKSFYFALRDSIALVLFWFFAI